MTAVGQLRALPGERKRIQASNQSQCYYQNTCQRQRRQTKSVDFFVWCILCISCTANIPFTAWNAKHETNANTRRLLLTCSACIAPNGKHFLHMPSWLRPTARGSRGGATPRQCKKLIKMPLHIAQRRLTPSVALWLIRVVFITLFGSGFGCQASKQNVKWISFLNRKQIISRAKNHDPRLNSPPTRGVHKCYRNSNQLPRARSVRQRWERDKSCQQRYC